LFSLLLMYYTKFCNIYKTLFFLFKKDIILHYIWANKESLNITETTYTYFLQESIQHTARPINPCLTPTVKTSTLLQLCHKLQINIVLLGLRPARHFEHVYHIPETTESHKPKCVIPFYIFHHYLYSLVTTHIKHQIVFCYHKEKVYLVKNYNTATPLLTHLPSSTSISFYNTSISNIDAWNIIHLPQPQKHFNFSIILYSTFEYKSRQSNKNVKGNIVGCYYSTEKSPQLHLLLTPCLSTFQFYLSVVQLPTLSQIGINYQNNLAVPNRAEGIKIKTCEESKQKKESVLNEEYCICQHPETQLFKKKKFPSPRIYNTLGNFLKSLKKLI